MKVRKKPVIVEAIQFDGTEEKTKRIIIDLQMPHGSYNTWHGDITPSFREGLPASVFPVQLLVQEDLYFADYQEIPGSPATWRSVIEIAA